MASFAIAGATSVATGAIFAPRLSYQTSFSSPLLAKRKQTTATKFGTNEVRCSSIEHNKRAKVVAATTTVMTTFGALNVANPVALALVDERMSTEGTGLSLGLSNNLLGWILLGVFGVIWSLYTVYTSTLDEDDDSGLSL